MLKLRLYLALLLSLLGMIVGVFLLLRGGIFLPFKKQLIEERSGVVLELAMEIEESKQPKRRLRRISKNMGIFSKLVRNPQENKRFRPLSVLEREERSVFLLKGKGTPMAIELQLDRPRRWLIVSFPVDLEKPRERVFIGLIVLTIFGVIGAWGVSRWSLKPLETASEAMNRIAQGDLNHRVSDSIGPAKESFNKMAERLEQVIKGQRDFMAAIGHELRTPIARLKIQIAMLEEEKRAASLEADVEELEELVESLLASARLERGAVSLHRVEVDVYDLFLDELARVDIGEREVTLEVEKGTIFHVDRGLFARVIRNLLSNIVRYTKEDVQIWLGAKREEERGILWVADSGEGVDPSLIHSLFDPFVRAEKSRNKVTGGLGLGLMLVRQVAQLHGGHVQAESNARCGHGLEITITI